MLNLKLDEILTGELKAIYNVARKTAEQRAKAEAEEDKAMTQKLLAILDEIEAVQTVHEETVDVLLDTVAYDEKPSKLAASITNRLPQHVETVTLKQLAEAAVNGQSWKASILSGKTNDTFVASSLVALDIDNKKSYTSVKDFMALDHKYQPCIVYETFSSTEQHNRFRVVFAFDKVITDYNEMCALYDEVKAQYPSVEFDKSVDPGKILFGGKTLNYFKNTINKTPSVKPVKAAPKAVAKSAHIIDAVNEKIEITKLDIVENLSNIAHKYAHIKHIDINESYEWINKNVKMTDVLGIKENTRFRCILEYHQDNNPSARIATYGDEQVYMCSCDACGYRLITLLSKVLDMSENKTRKFILDNLGISYGTEYQKTTKIYVADLLISVDKIMNQELKDYLNKRKAYRPYKLIIEFVYEHISGESLANDNDKIVFFISKRHLQDKMKESFISGRADQKLTILCELGLLRALPDSEIRSDALATANKEREKLQKELDKETLNRVDFYELVDLSPSVMAKALNTIKTMKESGTRQKGNNINRRINVFGTDEVLNNIHVQSTVNNKRQIKIQTKIENIITNLLDEKQFFTVSDLKEAYRATDKSHITKADAENTVLDFIPLFMQNNTIEELRINKHTKKQYDIPNEKRYSSKTIIYVKKSNC